MPDARPDALTDLLRDVVAECPPAVDFCTVLLSRPPGPVSAVLGFTGHHVVAADVDGAWLDAHCDAADFGSVVRAPFLAALGAHLGARVGHLDVVLAAAPLTDPGLRLVPVDPRGEDHRRVRRALTYRRDVRAWRTPDDSGVVMLGRGLAGRLELSFEVDVSARGRGLGTALARAGRALVVGEPVYAQVSPGNVASLRVLLAAGYRPIGSEVLLLHGYAGVPEE